MLRDVFLETLCFFRLTQSEYRSDKNNTCFKGGKINVLQWHDERSLFEVKPIRRSPLNKLITNEPFFNNPH